MLNANVLPLIIVVFEFILATSLLLFIGIIEEVDEDSAGAILIVCILAQILIAI